MRTTQIFISSIFLFVALNLFRSSVALAESSPFDFAKDLAKSYLGWNADIMRLTGDYTGIGSIDDVLKDPRLYAVTNEFGPTIINLKDLPLRSSVATSDQPTWSSWWFPKFQDTLFHGSRGQSSPLEKYDAYHQKRAANGAFNKSFGSAANWEEQNAYNPNAARWEGLCDAWSLAAIYYPEPKRPVATKDGLTFNVGDMKALLLKTYENVDESALKIYGVRFEGNQDSWVFPDIFPEQFHRFIEVQLFRKKQAFVMDHDPGVAVWSVPVFKANYMMEQDPADPNQVIVRTWLYNAAQITSIDDINFVGVKQETREYDYILRGERNSQGQLVVKTGAWMKGKFVDSREDHPDYFVTVPSLANLRRQSKNPNIDPALVDEIVKNSL